MRTPVTLEAAYTGCQIAYWRRLHGVEAWRLMRSAGLCAASYEATERGQFALSPSQRRAIAVCLRLSPDALEPPEPSAWLKDDETALLAAYRRAGGLVRWVVRAWAGRRA